MGFKSVTIIGGSARNKGALLMLDSTLKLLNQKKKLKKYTSLLLSQYKMLLFLKNIKSSFQNMQIIKWNQKSIIISFIFLLFKIKNTKLIEHCLNHLML